ncbi:hypothetical protein M405DRAFT_835798 [Rhizopogon salebrosus TDB-379]|nr:hypothetical protein M405DRAFT_835798 [Rhizopogon salebrosus TDB-379]
MRAIFWRKVAGGLSHPKSPYESGENSERPCVFNQLPVYRGYVAWFPHANVRGHGIINYGGSPESVKMKASSSLTFHCMSNVWSATHVLPDAQ